jgi:hypothetical protein
MRWLTHQWTSTVALAITPFLLADEFTKRIGTAINPEL